MRIRYLVLLLSLTPAANAQEIKSRDLEELRKEPIATGNSEVARLLQKWWAEKTAAGNAGDWYDNRDGEHSPLDLKPWPQLQKVHYTQEMLKARVNWAAQRQVLPAVVFGNSSTSAPATQGGSNPRQYYTNSQGLHLLSEHYAKNNLYIYPEHRDHDSGRNGRGPGAEEGYGDLYPTNTPYLIISQGSSGTDQPFMRAMPYVMAAFRPEVKEKLIATGTLMPTLQMIFRASNKHIKDGDYLKGIAHPSVFEGSWVDPVKMATMAHDLKIDALPPIVSLKVVEEDGAKPGIDFFDPVQHERLGDTPAVIARIFRGKERWRRMVVSAEESRDLNGHPLIFEWKLLRGDPSRVVITPKNDTKSIVEIKVAYPERRPISPGSPMESSRVDIGVFANSNGPWSAPTFVTWYGLENETRTYDDKERIAEIAYGAGETRITVKDWRKLLASPNANMLGELTTEQQAAIAKLDQERTTFLATSAEEKAMRKFDDKQNRKLADLLSGTIGLRLLKLLTSRQPEPGDETQTQAIKSATERFHPLGYGKLRDGFGPDQPLVKGPTAFDRDLEAFILADASRSLFGDAVTVQRVANFVDPRLSMPRMWRDVYLYDAKGTCVGWTRYAGKEPAHFTADGLIVVERDDLGRCKKAKAVTYRVDGNKTGGFSLRWSEGANEVEYVYQGNDDRRGTIRRDDAK